ncbi:hypothetical protein, partial [Paenibacillus cookii]|uniref:hypothetical protein n=1 Tax=Paenibacillus cookii TaxID=157839 RepID=UPI001BB364E8
SSILEVFGFGHLKTSPSWGEVPFLCPKILTAQGLRLLQNAQISRINKGNKLTLDTRTNAYKSSKKFLSSNEVLGIPKRDMGNCVEFLKEVEYYVLRKGEKVWRLFLYHLMHQFLWSQPEQ